MTFIGIDPGVSGGMARLINEIPYAQGMPETEQDVLEFLRRSGPSRAVLERVRSSPQMGVVSAFTFGRGYGGLRMALVASGIPFDEVAPQVWQKAMGCLTKGDKNVTKRRAQELFPQVKCTHAISDALLIAEYCRRLEVRG